MKDLILLECQQGSEEWRQARIGIPTASRFDSIVTSTGKHSSSATKYMAELMYEHLTGESKDSFTSRDMQVGIDLENKAREAYEFYTGNTVLEVGGVYKDDTKTIMASPDGLIDGQKKGLEIKCPKFTTHVEYVLNGIMASEYVHQVQGGMWVTGYDEWDFVSFCPDYKPMPLFLVTVARDDKLMKAYDRHIVAFSKTLEAHKKQLDSH